MMRKLGYSCVKDNLEINQIGIRTFETEFCLKIYVVGSLAPY